MAKVSNTTTGTLGLSDLHLRMDGLEQEHQWLLKQIKRKRSELNNFIEQMRTVATKIFHSSTPKVREMMELDQEIHRLFQQIFTKLKLSKKNRRTVQEIYEELQLIGIISYREDDEDELEQELEDLFDHAEEFSRHERESGSGYYDRVDESDDDSNDGKARNSEEARQIRQVFLKLAAIFHPDKANDDSAQALHTEVMKEINRAYQEGDLARLLEIEQQHELGEIIDNNSEDDLTRRCKILEKNNGLLKNQYEDLKRELRQVKNTSEGQLVTDYRKAKKEGVDAIALMLNEVDKKLNLTKNVHSFVKDFLDQKITIQDFIAGPPCLRTNRRDITEEMMEQIFAELFNSQFK